MRTALLLLAVKVGHLSPTPPMKEETTFVFVYLLAAIVMDIYEFAHMVMR